MTNNSHANKDLRRRICGKLEASVRRGLHPHDLSMHSVTERCRISFVLSYRRGARVRRSDCDPDGERDAQNCRLLERSAIRRVTAIAGPSVATRWIDSRFDRHVGEGHWQDTDNIRNADSRSSRSCLRWSCSAWPSRASRICLPLPRTRTRERARRPMPPCSHNRKWSSFGAWPMVSSQVEAR
jgi:hypothetical protein